MRPPAPRLKRSCGMRRRLGTAKIRLRRQRESVMSITIHPELDGKLRARAETEGLSVEAYVERIASDDEHAEQELEALALEGLNSGESIEANEKYWEGKRRRLIDRHQKTSARDHRLHGKAKGLTAILTITQITW